MTLVWYWSHKSASLIWIFHILDFWIHYYLFAEHYKGVNWFQDCNYFTIGRQELNQRFQRFALFVFRKALLFFKYLFLKSWTACFLSLDNCWIIFQDMYQFDQQVVTITIPFLKMNTLQTMVSSWFKNLFKKWVNYCIGNKEKKLLDQMVTF